MHEERAVVRKILWLLGMKVVQFVAVFLANNGQVENLVCVETAACSIVLVSTNLWFIRHLLRRPYASHRPSSKMGDPLNDAEMLTTRTVSLAAALLSLRDTLATGSASGERLAKWFNTNHWLMDFLCALLLVFVVRSNLRLFGGLGQDLKISAARILNTVKSSLTMSEEGGSTSEDGSTRSSARSRQHTGAEEIYFQQIDQMLYAESYRKIIMLQKDLQIDSMTRTEQIRWISNEQRHSTTLRGLFEGFSFFLILIAIVCGGMQIVPDDKNVSSSVRAFCTWIMTLLPFVMYIIMEVLVWKGKKRWAVEDREDGDGNLVLRDEEIGSVASPIRFNNYNEAVEIELAGVRPEENVRKNPLMTKTASSRTRPEENVRNKPPMIKSVSSRASISVTALAKKFENGAIV